MLRCAQLGAGEGGGARAAAEPLNGLMESGCWESVCACLNDLAQGRERCPFSIIGSRDSLQLVYEVFSRDGGRYLPMLVQHNLLQSFVALLREESVVCLHSWPKELDGGSDALCLLVDLVSQSVFLPFSPPGPVDEELLQLVQRVLAGPAEVVAKVVGVLRLMANSGSTPRRSRPTRTSSRPGSSRGWCSGTSSSAGSSSRPAGCGMECYPGCWTVATRRRCSSTRCCS